MVIIYWASGQLVTIADCILNRFGMGLVCRCQLHHPGVCKRCWKLILDIFRSSKEVIERWEPAFLAASVSRLPSFIVRENRGGSWSVSRIAFPCGLLISIVAAPAIYWIKSWVRVRLYLNIDTCALYDANLQWSWVRCPDDLPELSRWSWEAQSLMSLISTDIVAEIFFCCRVNGISSKSFL